MKKVSDKQKKVNKELKKIYKEIADTREHCCTGCGRYDVPLSHSHIIPRSRRGDLVTDINNITYHCLSIGGRTGCHDLWEHGTVWDKQKLLDYGDNMDYILQQDEEYYYLLID